MFGLARNRDVPKMLLLIVFVKQKDVVFQLLARFLLVGLGIGRRKIDKRSIRRPGDARHGCGVAGKSASLSAAIRQQIDLIGFGVRALGDKGDSLAVRRPAGRVLAVGAGG